MKQSVVSNRLADQTEYVFARIKTAVQSELKSNPKPMLDFSVGVPDFPTNEKLVTSYLSAVRATDMSKYPGYTPSSAFTTALRDWYRLRFKVDLNMAGLLPLSGAKEGIAHVPLALFNPGDTVLIPNPGYPAYFVPSLFAGAKIVPYDLLPETDFKINYDQLDKLLHLKPRFMWVNYPSNPTGQTLNWHELEELVSYARLHNIFILYDNAYSEIFFNSSPPPSILEIPGAFDCAIEFGSVSKSYSLAGIRLGWVCGNTEAVSAIAKLKTIYDSGVSQIVQSVGAEAFSLNDETWHTKMIQSYESRRNTLATYLPKLGLLFNLPPGSLYIWAKIPDSEIDSESYCKKLLTKQHIVFAPGSAFGSNGARYVRISIGIDMQNIDRYIS